MKCDCPWWHIALIAAVVAFLLDVYHVWAEKELNKNDPRR